MKHIRYTWYVLRHKWFVFLECVRYGIPLAGIIHDWHKLLPCEWIPYTETFYGPYPYDKRPRDLVDAFDRAWLHHIHLAPHHWQHYILREDSGAVKVLEMPVRYRKEMIADWIGAGRALGKYNKRNRLEEVRNWYLSNTKNIQLAPSTRIWVEKELKIGNSHE